MEFTVDSYEFVVLIFGIHVIAGTRDLERQNSSQLCPKNVTNSTINLVVPHASCASFYRCSRGVATAQACPSGLLFHEKILRCDFPHKVQCRNRTLPTELRTMVVDSQKFAVVPYKLKKTVKPTAIAAITDNEALLEYMATIVPSRPSKLTATTPNPNEYHYVHISSLSEGGFSLKHPHSSSSRDSSRTSKSSSGSSSSSRSDESTSTEEWDSEHFNSRHSDYWYPYHKKGSIRKHKNMKPKMRHHWDDKGLPLRRMNPQNITTQRAIEREEKVMANGCPVDPTVYWLIPHSGNCSLFYECHTGNLIKKECSYGLFFNAHQQVCDWPENANCIPSNNRQTNVTQNPTRAEYAVRRSYTDLPLRRKDIVKGNTVKLVTEGGFKKSTSPSLSDSGSVEYCSSSNSEDNDTLNNLSQPRSNASLDHTDNRHHWGNKGLPLRKMNSLNSRTEKTIERDKKVRANGCPVDPTVRRLLPHPGSCSLFYECHNGDLIRRECSHGLHFNAQRQVECELSTPFSVLLPTQEKRDYVWKVAPLAVPNICALPTNANCITTTDTARNHIMDPTFNIRMKLILKSGSGEFRRRGIKSDNKNSFKISTQASSHAILDHTVHRYLDYKTDTTRNHIMDPTLQIRAHRDDKRLPKRRTSLNIPSRRTIKGEVLANGCPVDPTVHRLVPHSGSCSLFYECHKGLLINRECSRGLFFNAQRQVCDWPRNANCIISNYSESYSKSSKRAGYTVVTNTNQITRNKNIADLPLRQKYQNKKIVIESSVSESEGGPNQPTSRSSTSGSGEYSNEKIANNGNDKDEEGLLLRRMSQLNVTTVSVPLQQNDKVNGSPVISVREGGLNQSTSPVYSDSGSVEYSSSSNSDDDDTSNSLSQPRSSASLDHTDHKYIYHETATTRKHLDLTTKIRPLDVITQRVIKGEEQVLANGCPVDPTVRWLIPHPGSCSLFYKCHNGDLVKKTCTHGLFFNSQRQVCDSPKNVNCIIVTDDEDNVTKSLEHAEHVIFNNTNHKDSTLRLNDTVNGTTERSERDGGINQYTSPVYIDSGTVEYISSSNSDDDDTLNNLSQPQSSASLDQTDHKYIYHETATTRKHFDLTTKIRPLDVTTQRVVKGEEKVLPNGCPVDPTVRRLLPHPGSCSLFYECLNGDLIKKTCGNGLFFSSQRQVCDSPENANCSIVTDDQDNVKTSPEHAEHEILNNTNHTDSRLRLNTTVNATAEISVSEGGINQSISPVYSDSGTEKYRNSTSSSKSDSNNTFNNSSQPRNNSASDHTDHRNNFTEELTTQQQGSPDTTTSSGRKMININDFLDNVCPMGPRVHWVAPHALNSTLFHECQNGEIVLKQCDNGSNFNVNLKVCDVPKDPKSKTINNYTNETKATAVSANNTTIVTTETISIYLGNKTISNITRALDKENKVVKLNKKTKKKKRAKKSFKGNKTAKSGTKNKKKTRLSKRKKPHAKKKKTKRLEFIVTNNQTSLTTNNTVVETSIRVPARRYNFNR